MYLTAKEPPREGTRPTTPCRPGPLTRRSGFMTACIVRPERNIFAGTEHNLETKTIMNATRILPDLQCSLLCEDVRPEANGNFILVGVIGLVRVPQVPVTAFKLCVFNRWTAGVGQFNENVRLIAPDQTTVLRKGQVKFALQDATHHATNVTVFPQVEFPAGGVYYVEVLVDDVMKIRFPLPVLVVQPPQQGAQQAPAKQEPQS